MAKIGFDIAEGCFIRAYAAGHISLDGSKRENNAFRDYHEARMSDLDAITRGDTRAGEP